MDVIPETDVVKMSVYRDGSPAYLKPPVTYSISELLFLPVGVASTTNDTGVELFPNPVKDELIVSLAGEYIGLTYEVFSIDWEIKIKGKIEKEILHIMVNNLPPGIYFLKAGNNTTIKFIKF